MLSLRTSTDESTKEHTQLVEAIRNGNCALAREILENHRKRGIKDLTKLMEEQRNVLQLL